MDEQAMLDAVDRGLIAAEAVEDESGHTTVVCSVKGVGDNPRFAEFEVSEARRFVRMMREANLGDVEYVHMRSHLPGQRDQNRPYAEEVIPTRVAAVMADVMDAVLKALG